MSKIEQVLATKKAQQEEQMLNKDVQDEKKPVQDLNAFPTYKGRMHRIVRADGSSFYPNKETGEFAPTAHGDILLCEEYVSRGYMERITHTEVAE